MTLYLCQNVALDFTPFIVASYDNIISQSNYDFNCIYSNYSTPLLILLWWTDNVMPVSKCGIGLDLFW